MFVVCGIGIGHCLGMLGVRGTCSRLLVRLVCLSRGRSARFVRCIHLIQVSSFPDEVRK